MPSTISIYFHAPCRPFTIIIFGRSACWVGLGRVLLLLPSALSLSLLSLSLVRNRHCETSSIGWGAQCRRVGLGGRCSDFGRPHLSLLPSRNGCVCLSVIVFGRRCVCPLFRLSLGTRDHTSTHAVMFGQFLFPSLRIFIDVWRKRGSSQCITPLQKSARVHKTCLSEGGRDMSRKARWGVRAALRVSFCVLFFRSFFLSISGYMTVLL